MAGAALNVYIVAPWRKKTLVKACNADLLRHGHRPLARWPEEEDGPAYPTDTIDRGTANALAAEYVRTILLPELDVMVAFDNDGQISLGGGRHFELGMAYVLEKKLALVGRPEHLFHALSTVNHFDLWSDCLSWLDQGAPEPDYGNV